jgi:hypothetical protein
MIVHERKLYSTAISFLILLTFLLGEHGTVKNNDNIEWKTWSRACSFITVK